MASVPAPLTAPPVYLLELFPLDPATGLAKPQYLASQDFVSAPTDSPASQGYDGVLSTPLVYKIDLAQTTIYHPTRNSGGSVSARPIVDRVRTVAHSDAGHGAMVIENAGDQPNPNGGTTGVGRYDFWRNLRWQGRPFTLYQGMAGQTRAQFTPIVSGRVLFLSWTASANQIQINVSSALDRLNKILQPAGSTYGGTGGADGGSDLAGKYKPVGLGLCREVPAPLLNSLNIYQAHNGAVTTWLQFCSQGAVIDAGPWTDYATYAALAAATVATGKVATCSALGLFRLGSAPVAPITCDFQVGSAITAADLAAAIFQTYGGLVAGTDYDATSVSALATAQAAACGWWSTIDAVNILDALDAILGGIGAYYTESQAGLIFVGRVEAPTIAGPTDPNCALSITIDDVDLDGLQLTDSPEPPSQVIVNGRKFYQVQTTGLAGGLSTARIADLAQQFRSQQTAVNGTVTTQWPLSIPLSIDSLMDATADLAAEAARVAALYQTQRDVFTVKITAPSLPVKPGDQVWLTHDRYGLAAGQAFRLLGVNVDAGQQSITLTLWG